ncbi:MAG: twin-arginine translocase TatA/TatE family subunit [Acidobacteriota bacterium]
MGPLGVPELIFIFILALLIFGPKKLPEIGRTIGKGMAEFRKASTELTRSINTELALDEQPAPPPLRAWEPTAPPPLTAARAPVPPPEPVAEPVLEPEDTAPAEASANEPLEPS